MKFKWEIAVSLNGDLGTWKIVELGPHPIPKEKLHKVYLRKIQDTNQASRIHVSYYAYDENGIQAIKNLVYGKLEDNASPNGLLREIEKFIMERVK